MMLKVHFQLFLTELRREWRAWWSYRFQALSTTVLWLVAFPFMMLTFDSVAGGYGPERRLASLIGFLVWNLCMSVLATAAESVTTEARQGTLESVLLSPISPLTIFSYRLTAVFIRQVVETAVLGLVLALILGLSFTLSGPALVVTFLTILSVVGVGLALGGIALVYKRIDSVVAVITLLAVLFTGALVPLNSLGYLFQMLKYTLPTTWGIDALRQVMIEGTGWVDLWHEGTWVGLGVQTAVFILIGSMVFNWGFQRALRHGSLGTY